MSRRFSLDDQIKFAALSGDNNPLHTDEVSARRYLFGEVVVHGIHALIWAMNQWLQQVDGQIRIKTLKVNFRGPIKLSENIDIDIHHQDAHTVRLQIVMDGFVSMNALLQWELSSDDDTFIADKKYSLESPRICHPEKVLSEKGSVALQIDRLLAHELFSEVVTKLKSDQLAALLATTQLIGMEVPGLHSVFLGLDVVEGDPSLRAHASMNYHVSGYDDRTSSVSLQVQSSGLSGHVSAAFRPSPVNQLMYKDIKSLVPPGIFRHERAFIIGGSRGIGAVAAKILTAGGADVQCTYHRGLHEAQIMRDEVEREGGKISFFQLDANEDPRVSLKPLGSWSPTFFGYFATPFAFAGKKGVYSSVLLHEYMRIYVDAFSRIFQQLATSESTLKNILYPSSSAIDEMPLHMGEYATAKASAEVMCQFFSKKHKHITFHCPRFSRLETDQTASIFHTEITKPETVLLPLLLNIAGCSAI